MGFSASANARKHLLRIVYNHVYIYIFMHNVYIYIHMYNLIISLLVKRQGNAACNAGRMQLQAIRGLRRAVV